MHNASALHAVDDPVAALSTDPIDTMFRAMCERRASDLRLSVGSPPYELKGVARFRGNAFMDRKGPGADTRFLQAKAS